MSKLKRVLHVFSSLDSGGVSNFVMNIYRELDYETIQFDFAMTSGEKGIYDNEVLSRGGRIFYFDTSKSISDNMKQILKMKGPFYAVHSHVFFYSGLVLKVAKSEKVPVRIAHAHNAYTGESRNLKRLLYEKMMQLMIRSNATCMLGCSKKACIHVFGKYHLNSKCVHVLPDGIDCNRFAFDAEVRRIIREEYGMCDKFVIGHVGHFNPAKNHNKILRVFRCVCSLRSDAVLLLVGDGDGEQQVREYVDKLHLTDRVVFAGAHSDVERYYQAMDVFIFPSRYEGFGMAMIEAQASGLSCLASDVVPTETNADGRSVYLSLKEDDELWAKTLLSLPPRDESKAQLEKVNSIYGIQQTLTQMKKIYE